MHHLVSDYVQYCAAFARYEYIAVYHTHFHINNLCATAVSRQRNACTSWGSHTHTRWSIIIKRKFNYCVIQTDISVVTCLHFIRLWILQFSEI